MLRPIGFQHCELGMDEALEDEKGGDYDEDTLDAEADEEELRASRAAAGSLGPAPVRTMEQETAAEAADPQELAALHTRLAQLVHDLAGMIVHEHGKENPLVALAMEAQASLKAGDAAGAAVRVARLQAGLREAG